MNHELSLKECQKEWHGTFRSYVIGFVGSILLTIISFFLVATQFLSGPNLIYTIASLALLQAIIQLIFFLHIGQEAKPRWESVVFIFMFIILLIIVIGSLWVMQDLNERMMPPMVGEMSHD